MSQYSTKYVHGLERQVAVYQRDLAALQARMVALEATLDSVQPYCPVFVQDRIRTILQVAK